MNSTLRVFSHGRAALVGAGRTAVVLAAVLASGFSDSSKVGAARDMTASAAPADVALTPGPAPADEAASARLAAFDAEAWPRNAVGAISPEVLKLALTASQCAVRSGAIERPSTLTIIDYSKPSVEPRLWVLDLATRALLFEELVAHGQGSGGNVPTAFSNRPNSHQTSLGLFVTDDPYVGRNGYSLRLDGLEAGFNDRARERAIVMHGAPYVNASISKSLGRLGRSHGCPAVRQEVARELIDRVKNGSLVFAYYPDGDWLERSKFLNSCN